MKHVQLKESIILFGGFIAAISIITLLIVNIAASYTLGVEYDDLEPQKVIIWDGEFFISGDLVARNAKRVD